MRNLSFLLVNLLLSIHIFAQNEYVTGLILEDEAYEQLPRVPRFEGAKYDEMPIKVDLSPYCPEVGFQGEIQSCVGWALGYGALTIERAIQNNLTDKSIITQNANSALFIYNQVKQNQDCNSGAKISDAVRLLKENGDCLASQFDTEIDNCSKEPETVHKNEAINHTVMDFMTLFSQNEKPVIKTLKIQKALAENHPVVIGLKILRNFQTLKDITYWRPEIGNQTPMGGHAMVVVGYDELRGAFQLMNSWGTDWGKNGFIWVKYKDFAKYCKYAYTLHLGEPNPSVNNIAANVAQDIQSLNETSTEQTPQTPSEFTPQQNIKPRIAGNFNFLYLNNESEEIELLPAAVTFNGKYYKVNRTDWEIGQFFQLVTTAESKNEYIYIFSVDNIGQVNIHWPRQEGLNTKFKGLNESALIPTEGAQIYIPSKNGGLKLTKKGIEHLCILFSKRPIENIKAISEYMSDQKPQFYDGLIELIQDYTIPADEINFANDKIEFSSNSPKGSIVPIVLELEAK